MPADMLPDTEIVARAIADNVAPDVLAQHHSNVAEWLRKAEEADAVVRECEEMITWYEGDGARGTESTAVSTGTSVIAGDHRAALTSDNARQQARKTSESSSRTDVSSPQSAVEQTGSTPTMLASLIASVRWRKLSAESHGRVFRQMAARAQGICDRLLAQKALYNVILAKEVAELRRLAGL